MMNKMMGQQGMGPEMADAILRNADRRTQSSIPRRDPRINPPVPEGGRASRGVEEIIAIMNSPEFQTVLNEEVERAQGHSATQQQYMHHAINNAITRFIGLSDMERGASPYTRQDPLDARERRGAAMRTATRGYNAP